MKKNNHPGNELTLNRSSSLSLGRGKSTSKTSPSSVVVTFADSVDSMESVSASSSSLSANKRRKSTLPSSPLQRLSLLRNRFSRQSLPVNTGHSSSEVDDSMSTSPTPVDCGHAVSLGKLPSPHHLSPRSAVHFAHRPSPPGSSKNVFFDTLQVGYWGSLQVPTRVQRGSSDLPHQKSSESYDSSVSAVSMASGSEEVSESRRSILRIRSDAVASPSGLEMGSSPTLSASSSVTVPEVSKKSSGGRWKNAISSFVNARTKPKREVKETPDEETDAIYKFLSCKECSSGTKCSDPRCPGRDPNMLPIIRKKDLGAQQRREVLRKLEGRYFSSVDYH